MPGRNPELNRAWAHQLVTTATANPPCSCTAYACDEGSAWQSRSRCKKQTKEAQEGLWLSRKYWGGRQPSLRWGQRGCLFESKEEIYSRTKWYLESEYNAYNEWETTSHLGDAIPAVCLQGKWQEEREITETDVKVRLKWCKSCTEQILDQKQDLK